MESLESVRRKPAAPPIRMLWRAVLAWGMICLAVAGFVLCARRLAGALVEPADFATLALIAALLASVAMAFRRQFVHGSSLPAARVALWALPTAIVAVWMTGVLLGNTSILAVIVLVGVLLAEEGWSWARYSSFTGVRADAAEMSPAEPATFASTVNVDIPSVTPAGCGVGDTEVAAGLRIANENDEAGEIETGDASDVDPSVSQSLVRSQQSHGELLTGWIRVDFLAGQRIAAAHLAICPPFRQTPRCDVEQAGGPSASLKITQAMTYGVRCEVKLDEAAAQPTSVVVEFCIQEAEGIGTEPSRYRLG